MSTLCINYNHCSVMTSKSLKLRLNSNHFSIKLNLLLFYEESLLYFPQSMMSRLLGLFPVDLIE